MNKFRVTCLIDQDRDDMRPSRVFATREKFATREEALAYSDTIAKFREPLVGYVSLMTIKDVYGWMVYDEGAYDGAPDGNMECISGSPDELAAVNDFCELFDKCTVGYNGVPCGGNPMSVDDENGSGYKRCDRCGML